MGTTHGGSPADASCACKTLSRTPWIETRPKLSFTVVSAPTTSNAPARRTSCSAKALSLPDDHEISALGRIIWAAGSRRRPPNAATAYVYDVATACALMLTAVPVP